MACRNRQEEGEKKDFAVNRPRFVTAILIALTLLGCSKPSSTASQAPPDAVRGKQIFAMHCSSCHGATGREGGATGPAITGERQYKNLDAVIIWIKNPSPRMPKLYPDPLNDRDVTDVAAFVETL
jgi:alcohol dehydrogenase (cytochrome c)